MALGSGVLPHLTVTYAAGNAAVSAALLVFMAQESDRAAQWRVAEIDRMQALFSAALPHMADPDLAAALTAGSTLTPKSLYLPDLDALRRQLLGVLIDLHSHVEAIEADWARGLEADILAHLVQTAQSRTLVLPPT